MKSDDFFTDFDRTHRKVVKAALVAWVVYLAVVLTFFAAVGYVAWHFLAKVW